MFYRRLEEDYSEVGRGGPFEGEGAFGNSKKDGGKST